MVSDYQKQYSKERYDYLVSIGLCPRCGKRQHADGFVLCADCICKMSVRRRRDAEKESARNKAYYEEKREKGLCVSCGKEAFGKVHCPSCARKQKLRKASKRVKAVRNENECLICKKPVLDGFHYCEEHYQQQRARMLKAREMSHAIWNNDIFF